MIDFELVADDALLMNSRGRLNHDRFEFLVDRLGDNAPWIYSGTLLIPVHLPGRTTSALAPVLKRIHKAVPDIAIVRVFEDFVTTMDIAHRLAMSDETVRLWSKGRHVQTPFPQKWAEFGSGTKRSLYWRWADVNEWLTHKNLSDEMTHPTWEQEVELNAIIVQHNRSRGSAA